MLAKFAIVCAVFLIVFLVGYTTVWKLIKKRDNECNCDCHNKKEPVENKETQKENK